MSSNKHRIVELGELGEELVILYLSSSISDISISKDPYDSTKDITAQGKSIEVKTQVRFASRNLFTVRRSSTNLKKCMSVDMLVFVEFDSSDYIRLWSPIDIDHYTDYSTFDGDRMRGWYINKNEIGPGCRLIRKIHLPQISARMKALSISTRLTKFEEKHNYTERPIYG